MFAEPFSFLLSKRQKHYSMNSQTLQNQIAKLLQSIGTPLCIAEAERVLKLNTLKRRFHFRNLNLTAEMIHDFFDLLDSEKDYSINSLSFSHNPIGDEGAQIIANRIPANIEEIGLVDCNIGNEGAEALLKVLDELPQLDMICIENNNLSNHIKQEFQKFAAFNPDLMIIV